MAVKLQFKKKNFQQRVVASIAGKECYYCYCQRRQKEQSPTSNIASVSEGKIVLYSTPDSNVYADVAFKDETFWATQKVLAELFDTSTDNIMVVKWGDK